MEHKLIQDMPNLSHDERERLKQDIASSGKVLCPVILDQNGEIVDGHNRAAIAAELGIDFPVQQHTFSSDAEKRAFALRVNLNRRHLSPEQTREVSARKRDVAAELRGQGKTQAAVAAMVGVSQQAVDQWEAGHNSEGRNMSTDCRVKGSIERHESSERR